MYMFLVQYTDRHYGSVLEELKALIELDIPYRTFGTIKETNIITGLEELDDSYQYIVRCGTKCLQLFSEGNAEGISDAVKENIKRNIFYNRRNFDQEKYNTPDLPVLNHDAVFCKVRQALDSTFETSKFIKPSEDLKAFHAGIIKGEYKETVLEYITSNPHRADYASNTMMIADPKQITNEYRFICTKGSVLACSSYRKDNKMHVKNDVPEDIINKAIEYSELYQPSDIFTMDLCISEGHIRIVEYNCWHCSGLYAMNIPVLFNSIINLYKERYE